MHVESKRLVPVLFAVILAASVIQPAFCHPPEACHFESKFRIKRPAGGFAITETSTKPPPFSIENEFKGLSERFFDNLCDPPMCLMVLCNGSCLYSQNPCRVSTHLKSEGAQCRVLYEGAPASAVKPRGADKRPAMVQKLH